jgi:RecA-family ATPase
MPRSFIVPYGDFMAHEFKDGNIVAFGCCRGELALMAGVTNKGKSTLMRVISMCAASGREFSPFVTASSEGLRVVLMDYEGSAARTQADLRLMEQNLTEDKRELLTNNLFVCHAPRLVDAEPLTLSLPAHMVKLRDQARPLSPDIIVIDTMSAAFATKSENDNAEISRVIMKPVIEHLARPLNCVAVVVGHIGKASREEARLASLHIRCGVGLRMAIERPQFLTSRAIQTVKIESESLAPKKRPATILRSRLN